MLAMTIMSACGQATSEEVGHHNSVPTLEATTGQKNNESGNSSELRHPDYESFVLAMISDFENDPLPAQRLLVDSGAGLHACPLWHAPNTPVEPSPGVPARTATGQAVRHHGTKKVTYNLPDGSQMGIRYECMDVNKPVVSVGRLVNAGYKVIFDVNGSAVWKDGKKLNLVQDKDVFYLLAKLNNFGQGDDPPGTIVYPIDAEGAPLAASAKDENEVPA